MFGSVLIVTKRNHAINFMTIDSCVANMSIRSDLLTLVCVIVH